MTAPDDIATALKPQDQLLFLLGGMQKQLEAIALEQADARGVGESFRAEIRDKLATQGSDIEVLKSKQVSRTPWYSVAGGLSGIGGLVLAVIALLKVLNP